MNAKFLQMGIPHKVITETKKTFLPVVGKSFWFVRPSMAILDPERHVSIPEKDHNIV